MSERSRRFDPNQKNNKQPPRILKDKQVDMIEEALRSIGDFGEVRLVMQKGRLRFVITQESHDALKWLPGMIDRSAL
jgi:hypothetical protein